jgi:hypothetical protein
LDHEHHEISEKRETANADVYPAISRSVEDIAAGRAEETIFFTKNLHTVQIFCEKDRSRTMLPQANRASTWSNVQFVNPPRNSYRSLIF